MIVDSPGVTLQTVTLVNSGAALSASYSVAASAQQGTSSVTITTNAGSDSVRIELVSSVPYIEFVSPNWWVAGQTTNVTIVGAGFGGGPGIGAVQGSVSISPGNSAYPVIFNVGPGGWSDGLIYGTVTTTLGDPGQNVSVSVTGGDYGFGFLSNQGNGKTSAPATASVVAAPSACAADPTVSVSGTAVCLVPGASYPNLLVVHADQS